MTGAASIARTAVDTAVRDDWGKMLAILAGQFRDIEAAEDALQDAIIAALVHWPEDGVPQRPVAWLIQTARRKAIDRLRRSENFARKRDQIALLAEIERSVVNVDDDSIEIPDERLRLIFTCCHPALAENIQVPLTLHTLCGLSALQVANAFLVSEPTMRQRLVRAKRKIKAAGIPYRVPAPELLAERLDAVVKVVYLIFNEGYRSNSGVSMLDASLCDEAIRLGGILETLIPDNAEILGLISLMSFHHSRYLARTDETGQVVSLARQNRQRWLTPYIEKGEQYLRRATELRQPGPYQIQAAISAVHAQASDYEATDWRQIVLLYEKLQQYQPSPIVQLNAAVALSHAQSPQDGLALLAVVESEPALQRYQPLFAARADILKRAGHTDEAKRDFARAIDLSQNAEEREFLREQMRDL